MPSFESNPSLRVLSRLLLAVAIGSAEATAAAQDAEDGAEGEDVPRLRAPEVSIPSVDGDETGEDAGAEASGEETAVEEAPAEEALPAEETLPDPERTDERQDGAGTDPTVAPWRTPETVFEVHGYMRMRAEFQDQFFLGRGREFDLLGDNLPFSYWQPLDDGARPDGGCRGGAEVSPGPTGYSACDQNALAYANMRLRIEPTIHLSDDVRVRMQLDLLDNVVMGSTPAGFSVDSAWARQYSSYVPYTAAAGTIDPPIAGRNSLSDSIVVRRAWAEVRNRGLGELRFGRMGAHWGLGLLFNDGRGIDQDHQTDVDRIMAVVRLFGLYGFAAWDFASEGLMYVDPANWSYQAPSFDRVRLDDVDQMVFGVARRMSPEEQAQALERHEVVINAGAMFMYRSQNLTTEGVRDPFATRNGLGDVPTFVRRGFETFTPDIWVQVLYEDLRLELEAVGVFGQIDNLSFDPATRDTFVPGGLARQTVAQFGLAFEGEYHLLNDQLGIYFNFGLATGDADQEGLSMRAGSAAQGNRPGGPDRNMTAFAFHPGYRQDLILYRNILGQINGSYYFRPGLSYDFVRSSFGQLLGVRADVIYSRAMEAVQTWGNSNDLGIEIDATAYYRSEDGPDLLDGFQLSVQYGILFPLRALGYAPSDARTGAQQNAQTIRLILGVQY